MSARIDHAGEAVACEEAGLSIMRKHEMAPHMEAVMQFDLARLHAQLALVEQQRIANLIAYVHLLETQYAEAARHSAEFDWKTREESVARHGIALARIREGLGL